MSGVFQSVTGFVRTATSGKSAQEKARQTKTSPADVVRRLPFLLFSCLNDLQISWSGCKDSQTSADAVEAGAATGAMSYVSGMYIHSIHDLTRFHRPLSMRSVNLSALKSHACSDSSYLLSPATSTKLSATSRVDSVRPFSYVLA